MPVVPNPLDDMTWPERFKFALHALLVTEHRLEDTLRELANERNANAATRNAEIRDNRVAVIRRHEDVPQSTINEIVGLYRNGWKCAQIGHHTGVDHRAVAHIVRRKRAANA